MTLDELCEMVMGLRPNHFMALNGAGAGIIGSIDSGSGALSQLQQATLQFASNYKTDTLEQSEVAKQDVIGKAMVAQTLDAISEEKADQIADALEEIMQQKEGKQ